MHQRRVEAIESAAKNIFTVSAGIVLYKKLGNEMGHYTQFLQRSQAVILCQRCRDE